MVAMLARLPEVVVTVISTCIPAGTGNYVILREDFRSRGSPPGGPEAPRGATREVARDEVVSDDRSPPA
jgi:hypothetical protein